tara:strand:- start:1322 stop:1675 length:354 start_codon:yes stop_codon:yes gene_type:complete
MAIINHILQSEMQGIHTSEGLSGSITESNVTSAETEAAGAISGWGSIPMMVQHQLCIIAHFGTLASGEISAANSGDWTALRSALSGNSSVSADIKEYVNLRMGLIVGSEFDLDAEHN